MAKPKKITQNINKDAGLMDLPKVSVPNSQWETKSSNYLTLNIGDIVPVFVDEVLPDERRRITMGMLSHMTTPLTALMNAQYTEFRAFFVPHRLSADLLNGYSTRKSPFVKVFGEDNASTSADIIVPLAQQKLPKLNAAIDGQGSVSAHLEAFGGILDSLDYVDDDSFGTELTVQDLNWLSPAAYELIYQYAYRNQNREAATNSQQYKFLFNAYNRATDNVNWDDKFHKANREKDYFTGSQPFTQKGDPVSAGLVGNADIYVENNGALQSNGTHALGFIAQTSESGNKNKPTVALSIDTVTEDGETYLPENGVVKVYADLSSASGINIEQLRLMIKLQEALEKDAMYGSKYAEYCNSRFGCSPMSLELEEPLELKKVTITSQMQPIFQTSSTASEQTILGTIGANATTQSGEFEIVPLTKFREYGYLIICAVHKAQNSYDSAQFKPKHIFKFGRFDFYTPELNDLGFQPVQRKEFNVNAADDNIEEAVSYNEAWAEYRFKFNKVHGMFEPSRNNALDYWTLASSSYNDVQSLYKQDVTELNRAISVTSVNSPQFYDAFGFIEYCDKPMSLHSIPGMDGVI